MKTAIWWLRRDLRLLDNQALQAALAFAPKVLPVFLLDPALLHSGYVGEKRLSFLFGCLAELDRDLRSKGSYLVLRKGSPAETLPALIQETGAERVFAERDVSPYATQRDRKIEQQVPVEWVGFPTVHPPWAVHKADGSPYTVFTPFSKAWKALSLPTQAAHDPLQRIDSPMGVQSESLPELPPLESPLPFPPGEAEALLRLERFCAGGPNAPVYQYSLQRNRMDAEGTSGLSPYLRFGLVSPRRAAALAYAAMRTAPNQAAYQGAETWLNELIWREFYQHILYHFPQARAQSFRPELRSIRWENDPRLFEAWCQGQTGYPVVDAAMRQLAQTGWMHNRARMIVASFLTKDLHIDWRWGEKWFMQHLIDGDPAANNGGWQWTAGTGTDAAPYFRIFNPVAQGNKFDPQGDFVRHWVPELRNIPAEWIHQPWMMPPALQAATGCRIGQHYPQPVVEHAAARERTLRLYGEAKNGS